MLAAKTQIVQVNVIEKKFNNFKKYFNFRLLNRLIIILIIVLGVWYVASINDISIIGFTLNDLKSKRNDVSVEKQNLELKIMALSSLANINERVKNLKMVAVGQIDYISAASGIVAKK